MTNLLELVQKFLLELQKAIVNKLVKSELLFSQRFDCLKSAD